VDDQQAYRAAGRPLVAIRGRDVAHAVQAIVCVTMHGLFLAACLSGQALPLRTQGGHGRLWLHMQVAMLFAAENLASGQDALAPGQMHAAMDAPHHILSLHGESGLLRFLPLFNAANIGSQRPENEHGYKGKK
jgi:hypothetical protein